jgi:hypothetical protein
MTPITITATTPQTNYTYSNYISTPQTAQTTTMLSSHLAFALLSAMAMASPVPQKRAETTCTDINYCEFKGCWTEMDGQSWCSPDDGNTASTFSLHEILFDTGMDLKSARPIQRASRAAWCSRPLAVRPRLPVERKAPAPSSTR